MSEAEALYREALQGRRKVLGNSALAKNDFRECLFGIPNGIHPQQSNELTPKMAICKKGSTGLPRLPLFWGPPAVSFRGCIVFFKCIFGVFLVKTHCFIKDVQIRIPGASYRITVLDLQGVSPANICQKKMCWHNIVRLQRGKH